MGLRFLYLKAFFQLSLGPGRRGVYWSVVFLALLIKVTAGGGLDLSFGLGSDDSFDQIVSTVQVPTFFVNL